MNNNPKHNIDDPYYKQPKLIRLFGEAIESFDRHLNSGIESFMNGVEGARKNLSQLAINLVFGNNERTRK